MTTEKHCNEYEFNNGKRVVACAVVFKRANDNADLLAAEDDGDSVKFFENVPLGEGGGYYRVRA